MGAPRDELRRSSFARGARRLPGVAPRLFKVETNGTLAPRCLSRCSMDHVRRVVWFTVGFCAVWILALSSASAQSIPATLETQASAPQLEYRLGENPFRYCGPGPFPWVTSPTVACEAVTLECMSSNRGWDPPATSVAAIQPAGPGSDFVCEYSPGGHRMTLSARTGGSGCPSGWNLNGASCERYTCPAGYTGPNDSNQCTPTVCNLPSRILGGVCRCPANAAEFGSDNIDEVSLLRPGSGLPPPLACVEGCTIQVRWALCSGAGAARLCLGSAIGATGATCTPGGAGTEPAPTPETPETECAASGRCLGAVNGQPVCLPCSSLPTPSERGSTGTGTSTTTNPDGSTTTRDVVEDRRVICEAGACNTIINTTTTTTTRNPAGQVTGTTTTTETATRPGDQGSGTGRGGSGNGNGDGEGSGFGGACVAGFRCEGDAIQCAIAREQHRRNCETLEPVGGTLTQAQAETYFNESRSFDKATLTAQPVTLGSLDSSSFVASQGAQDFSITVAGRTVTIALSSVNTYLALLGNVWMLIAAVIAFRIVASGVA